MSKYDETKFEGVIIHKVLTTMNQPKSTVEPCYMYQRGHLAHQHWYSQSTCSWTKNKKYLLPKTMKIEIPF